MIISILHAKAFNTMNSHPHNQESILKKLSYSERLQLHSKLRRLLTWIKKYEQKEPLLRTREDKKEYRQKALESALLTQQLSQYALIARNQLAYHLIHTMEIMEMAMDADPDDDEKYYAYQHLKKAYVKFMKAFHEDFLNN